MQAKYGNTVLELPEEIASSAFVLKLEERKPIENPEIVISSLLTNPDLGPRLKDIVKMGEQICIIVNDATRVARTEVIMPILIDELKKAGIRDGDIFIQFAEGLHRPTTADEMEQIIGKEISKLFKLYNHDAYKSEDLVRVGFTKRGTPVDINKRVVKSDRIIILGSINYHFFAGFGGGYKSLVPGVAGRDTIEANHSLMLQEGSKIGVLNGNPVHEDLKEAAKMVGCDFAIYTVLNEAMEILTVFGGEIESAHKKGCSYVENTYGVKISSPADLVIVSCGGFPKDINVYQAQKTLENAAQAVKKGGVIIFIAECREGVGSDKYFKFAKKYKSLPELKAALDSNFEIGGHKAYAVKKVTEKCDVLMVTMLESDVVSELGFQKCNSLEKAVELGLSKVGKDPYVYYMPAGSITTPILA